MKIEMVTIGMFQSNAYIVIDEATSACAIIDCGENGKGIAAAVAKAGAKPEKVLLTHAHVDHIGGLRQVQADLGPLPAYLHPKENKVAEAAPMFASLFGVQLEPVPMPEHELVPGETIEIGSGIRFHVLFVPGHSPGSVAFYDPHAGVCIVGDTLFAGGIGRTDLPGGNGPELLRSIREQLFTLPDDTLIYPGHGPSTTVAVERETNPFLRPGSRFA